MKTTIYDRYVHIAQLQYIGNDHKVFPEINPRTIPILACIRVEIMYELPNIEMWYSHNSKGFRFCLSLLCVKVYNFELFEHLTVDAKVVGSNPVKALKSLLHKILYLYCSSQSMWLQTPNTLHLNRLIF